jgi:hypothetical protein
MHAGSTTQCQKRRRCVIAAKARRGRDRSKRAAPGSADAGTLRKPRVEWTPGIYALIGLLFLGVALLVYEPALEGPFVSDDNHYLKNNSYIHELSVENLLIIFDPFGPATVGIVNFAPVQLLIHAVAWDAFGAEVRGHHVVNIVLHALVSVLLVPLFRRTGVPPFGALFAGAFFLLHPANVEAVAWISQLKSTASMALVLAALLAFPKRPALATLLFVLALLAKPIAVFAMPVAALFTWANRETMPWKWLALWGLLFVVFSVFEFTAHQRSGAADAVLHDTPWVLVRTMMALAMRYLVMASTSIGVSAFHEPEPAYSMGDPWWIASVLVLGLLGWRTWVAARSRSVELAYWVWALVSFAPISQIFPFLYPLADRYLYFTLPGLLGGVLLAGRDGLERLARVRGPNSALPDWFPVALVVCGAVVLVPFGVHSHARASVLRSSTMLVADAARHYPDGVSANLLRAKRAAQHNDVATAVAALRIVYARGFNQFEQLLADRSLWPIKDEPAFKELISDIALGWIESIATREAPSQGELRMVARAHVVRDEYDEAADTLRQALEVGGPMDDQIRTDLEVLSKRVP